MAILWGRRGLFSHLFFFFFLFSSVVFAGFVKLQLQTFVRACVSLSNEYALLTDKEKRMKGRLGFSLGRSILAGWWMFVTLR